MQYWDNNANGLLEHSYKTMLDQGPYGPTAYGPGRSCPYRITVTEDGIIVARLVGPDYQAEDIHETILNPGAARWLGNRLIEAAVLHEAEQVFPPLRSVKP